MLAIALKSCFVDVIRAGAVITAILFVIPDHAFAFGVRAFVLALSLHRSFLGVFNFSRARAAFASSILIFA
jgi:hypothetical protein